MSPKRLVLALAVLLAFAPPVVAEGSHPPPDHSTPLAPDAPKCGHGVAKKVCTRCNPKLAPVFKAKGDWCAEHERPESQCALCHPELARKGVK